MPNCKICGRSTEAALVAHRECLEQAMGYMCNYNCRWLWICEDQERLRAVHCEQCPLYILLREEHK